MRTAGSTRVSSSLAILGLIGTSILLVLFLNASSLANPTLPFQNNSPTPVPGPTGTLVVQVHTNQNETDRLSNPTNRSFALGQKGFTVTVADNSSNPQIMITDTKGGSLQELAPGRYVVRMSDQTLSIKVPVQIFAGNETKVRLTINGTAYPVVYSEESGVFPAVGKVRSDMFVELQSSTSVASVNDLVLLQVREGAPGVGYLANATVLAQQPPTQGTEWLELGASTTINPVNATSISLTTWTYSSVVTMQPIGIAGVSADA
ncbi:MAG TPA: hypothetical protein VEO75_01980 [Nitrososphaerales archaeon]|nr:hypothetical protein [Nitrososphaerales archaeon]